MSVLQRFGATRPARCYGRHPTSADPGPQRFQGSLRIGGWTLHEGPSAFTVIPVQSFESLICRLCGKTVLSQVASCVAVPTATSAGPVSTPFLENLYCWHNKIPFCGPA